MKNKKYMYALGAIVAAFVGLYFLISGKRSDCGCTGTQKEVVNGSVTGGGSVLPSVLGTELEKDLNQIKEILMNKGTTKTCLEC